MLSLEHLNPSPAVGYVKLSLFNGGHLAKILGIVFVEH